ncbi:MAG TPA: chloride channel protein, partial [Polyangiales bacterium]
MTTPKDVPLTPALAPIMAAAHVRAPRLSIDRRVLTISALCMTLALVATWVALGLTRLIGLFTNLAFYQRFDASFASPADNRLGPYVVIVPVIGGLLVGVLARFGSAAIR